MLTPSVNLKIPKDLPAKYDFLTQWIKSSFGSSCWIDTPISHNIKKTDMCSSKMDTFLICSACNHITAVTMSFNWPFCPSFFYQQMNGENERFTFIHIEQVKLLLIFTVMIPFVQPMSPLSIHKCQHLFFCLCTGHGISHSMCECMCWCSLFD